MTKGEAFVALLNAVHDARPQLVQGPMMSDAHLETVRVLANAPDRDDAGITEITLRAALAETVAEIDRLRAREQALLEQREEILFMVTAWVPPASAEQVATALRRHRDG